MQLYDKDGKLISFDISINGKRGSYSTVYRLDTSKCLKVFDNPLYCNIRDIGVFNELMSFDSKNFYKIYQLLYDRLISEKNVASYLMRYYCHEIDNILDMPMDYFLANLSDLWHVMKELSKRHIGVYDLHDENIVLTRDRMVIIDADNYYRDNSSFLLDENKKWLYGAFNNIMLNNICDYYNSSLKYDVYSMSCVINQLFSIDNSLNIINRKVRRYKRPIDYILDNVK